jgi:hypothetical protein
MAAEGTTLAEVEDEVVDDRSDWFHEVEGKALATAGVAMDQGEPIVESHDVTRQYGFGLKERIAVVGQGIDGTLGLAVGVRRGEYRPATVKSRPVGRDRLCILGRKARDAGIVTGPALPVEGGGGGLDLLNLLDRSDAVERPGQSNNE